MGDPARYRFPGMDPWLEAPRVWEVVHKLLISGLVADLNRLLRPDLVAVPVRSHPESCRQPFIQVHVPPATGRPLTVIEVLSPADKAGGRGARDAGLRRAQEILTSGVHWVEVDLLRTGVRTVPLPRNISPACDYQVVVRRASEITQMEVYPIPLRRRLPRIRAPIVGRAEDAVVDLQSLLEQAYRDGSCDLLVDYSRPPDPPLSEEDARWARELLGGA